MHKRSILLAVGLIGLSASCKTTGSKKSATPVITPTTTTATVLKPATTATASDGSTSTTTTAADGTITVVKRAIDGTVTTVSTRKDGVVTTSIAKNDGTTTTTTRSTDGTSTVVVTAINGATTTTVTKADGTVSKSSTVVTKNANGTTTTVTTNPNGTTSTVITNADGTHVNTAGTYQANQVAYPVATVQTDGSYSYDTSAYAPYSAPVAYGYTAPAAPLYAPPTYGAPTYTPAPGPVFVDCGAYSDRKLVASVYKIPSQSRSIPNFSTLYKERDVCLNQLDVTNRNFKEGFPGVSNLLEWFGLDIRWSVNIPADGTYKFFLNSDDGSILWIDNNLVVNNDGIHSHQERSGSVSLTAGYHSFHVSYIQGPKYQIALELAWQKPYTNYSEYIPTSLFARPQGY
ncbi:MAG: hypothetical protein H7249_00160 [Chitinophagaceae bacterium]|nr:hypothetical protein [Oligoflexus sp.]